MYPGIDVSPLSSYVQKVPCELPETAQLHGGDGGVSKTGTTCAQLSAEEHRGVRSTRSSQLDGVFGDGGGDGGGNGGGDGRGGGGDGGGGDGGGGDGGGGDGGGRHSIVPLVTQTVALVR